MSTWRERRPHAEPPPRTVGHVVARTVASLRATRAVEAGLFLVAAALLVRAAVEWQAAGPTAGAPAVDPASARVWALALTTGALAALAWWREHPVSAGRVADALDRRLRHHGALVTAWELERRADASRTPPRPAGMRPMERLVVRRVLERLRLREALHAVLPPLLVPVAAPVVAALVLLLVIEARPASGEAHVDPARLAAGLEISIDEAVGRLRMAAAEGLVDPGEAEAAIRRLREALSAARRSPEGPEHEAALARLDQELARLEARGETAGTPDSGHPAPVEARAWSAARAWLDALRNAAPPGGPSSSTGGGGMGEAGLAPGPGNGIMSGSSAGPEDPQFPSVTPSRPAVPVPARPPAAGPTGGGTRWWPAEQDGLVEAWLERASGRPR